jgi:hypothetical protein
MKKGEKEIQQLRELIRKGLDITFQKLVLQKRTTNGILILSEQGKIKKVNAAEINI